MRGLLVNGSAPRVRTIGRVHQWFEADKANIKKSHICIMGYLSSLHIQSEANEVLKGIHSAQSAEPRANKPCAAVKSGIWVVPAAISRVNFGRYAARFNLGHRLLGRLFQRSRSAERRTETGKLQCSESRLFRKNIEAELSEWIGASPDQRERRSRTEAAEAIKNCVRLRSEKLDLRPNSPEDARLTSLPDIFDHVPQLKWLELFNNRLSDLPKSIGSLKCLEDLDLASNQFSVLPKIISQLSSLETLHLSRNQLRSLPDGIGRLPKLTSLYAKDNALETLPSSLGSLRRLKSLFLCNNRLISLPSSIGQLSELKTLDVKGNKLSRLPGSLCFLVQLETLDVQNNQLFSLPEAIGSLHNLRYLMLGENQLRRLPTTIGSLVKLVELSLNNNHLTRFPKNIDLLERLQMLELSKNQIYELPEQFALAPKRMTCLTGNPLSTISVARIAAMRPADSQTLSWKFPATGIIY
jgi:Leucine-rich repeat (LRR) protein